MEKNCNSSLFQALLFALHSNRKPLLFKSAQILKLSLQLLQPQVKVRVFPFNLFQTRSFLYLYVPFFASLVEP